LLNYPRGGREAKVPAGCSRSVTDVDRENGMAKTQRGASHEPRSSVNYRTMRIIRKKNLKGAKSRVHLPVVVEQDEDGAYIVSVPTLQGCRSYGLTFDEAMQNITEAAKLCLEDEALVSDSTFIGVRDLEIVR
jgi:predicted RNase H-like HicB family nuclease